MLPLSRIPSWGLLSLSLAFTSAAAEVTLNRVFEFTGYENSSQNVGFVEGPDGNLYGWIGHAGQDRQSVVWRIGKDGTGFTVLHTFTGPSQDAEDPTGLVYGSDGNLYGVAQDQQSLGRVFAMPADGSNYRVLKQFDLVTDKTAGPFGLVEASDGRLYGVTGTGAPTGVVYGIGRDGTGFGILHRFGQTRTDGQFPRGLLLESKDGFLYGVTASDRTQFLGTVYRVGLNGGGYEILHQFKSDGLGAQPDSGLVLGSDGFLHGQASRGGPTGLGGLYKLRPDGSDYGFFETGTGGAQWYRSVCESGDGHLYGIQPGGSPLFNGTIFRTQLDGSGAEVLHTFPAAADSPEGVRPKQLLHARDGFLYCITHRKAAATIGTLTAFTPILMRFGPVALPPTDPTESVTVIPRLVDNGSGQEFRLSVSGMPGRSYQVQVSPALPPSWETVTTLTSDAEGKAEYADPNPSTAGSRYFRVLGP
ncbi:MAG: choice-of-anchor tandem repeat GloVer-containing protein [Verrucomicrobiota bacterium]